MSLFWCTNKKSFCHFFCSLKPVKKNECVVERECVKLKNKGKVNHIKWRFFRCVGKSHSNSTTIYTTSIYKRRWHFASNKIEHKNTQKKIFTKKIIKNDCFAAVLLSVIINFFFLLFISLFMNKIVQYFCAWHKCIVAPTKVRTSNIFVVCFYEKLLTIISFCLLQLIKNICFVFPGFPTFVLVFSFWDERKKTKFLLNVLFLSNGVSVFEYLKCFFYICVR